MQHLALPNPYWLQDSPAHGGLRPIFLDAKVHIGGEDEYEIVPSNVARVSRVPELAFSHRLYRVKDDNKHS